MKIATTVIDKRTQRRFFIIVSTLLMLIGGMLYILYRPTSLIMFSWFSSLGFDNCINTMRAKGTSLADILPCWIVFSLPQALWCFSGFLAIHAIWLNVRCVQEQFWLTFVLLLALGGELGQLVGIIDGVFDFIDLLFLVLAFCLALFMFFIISNDKKKG